MADGHVHTRWDRATWVTRGGWVLFAVSTVLAAGLVRGDAVRGDGAVAESGTKTPADGPRRSAGPSLAALEPDDFPPPHVPADPAPPRLIPDDAASRIPAPLPSAVVADETATGDVSDDLAADIWGDVLGDLPPEVGRNILSLRDRFGPVVPDFDAAGPAPAQTAMTPGTPRTRAVSDAPMLLPPAADPWAGPGGGTRAFADDGVASDGLRGARRVIRHNLANLFTPGFKRLEVLTADRRDADGPAGAVPLPVRRDQTPGPHRPTGRPLDAAVDGPGLFRLAPAADDPDASTDPGDFRLTRVGLFAVGAGGRLVFAADPNFAPHPPVHVPAGATDPRLGVDGTVLCTRPDGTEATAGRLTLARCDDPDSLTPAGPLMFAGPDSVRTGFPGDDGFGPLVPGTLEGSNVDPDAELDRLATAERLLRELDTAPHETREPERVAGRGAERF